MKIHYFDQFKDLPRQVYLICLARVVLGISSMSFSFSSLLMNGVIGLSAQAVARVMFIMSWTSIAGGLIGGKLADRFGRKKIASTAFTLQALGYCIAFFVCKTIWMVPILIITQGLASAGYPVFAALISDNATKEKSIECFSLLYLCQNIGVAIGPAIGGMLFYSHLQWVYGLQAIIVIIGTLFFRFIIHENYNREEALKKAEEQRAAKGSKQVKSAGEQSLLSVLWENNILLLYIGGLACITMCYQMVNYMLPLQTQEMFGMEISARYSGLVWTTNGVVIVLFTAAILNFTKKHHQFVNMAIGTCLYFVGYGSYAFLRNPNGVIIGAAIWTLGEIMISTGSGAFLAANSPASHVARCQSLYELSRSIGRSVGPIVFGYVLEATSYSTVWKIVAVSCICIGSVMYMFWIKRGKPER